MRNPTALLTLALLFVAPAALAEGNETNSTRPDDAAWVDECPPEHMCAAGGDPNAYGSEDCVECTGGPVDGPGETCLDGDSGNEGCLEDVQYFGGEPTRGPADGSCENCRGDTAGNADAQADGADVAAKAVPAPGVAVAILGVAGVAVLALVRK